MLLRWSHVVVLHPMLLCVACSGPMLALCLAREDAVAEWRKMLTSAPPEAETEEQEQEKKANKYIRSLPFPIPTSLPPPSTHAACGRSLLWKEVRSILCMAPKIQRVLCLRWSSSSPRNTLSVPSNLTYRNVRVSESAYTARQ